MIMPQDIATDASSALAINVCVIFRGGLRKRRYGSRRGFIKIKYPERRASPRLRRYASFASAIAEELGKNRKVL